MPAGQYLLPENPHLFLAAPPTTTTGELFGPPAYNFYDRPDGARVPTLGTPALAGALAQSGYENITHKDLRFVNARDYLGELSAADALLVTAITVNSGPAIELARVYKKLNPNGVAIMGGPHATALPEQMLEQGIDIVVRREGDGIAKLIKELQVSGTPEAIPGVSYRDGHGISETPDAAFLSCLRPDDPPLGPGVRGKERVELLRRMRQLPETLPHPIYPTEVQEKATVNMVTTSRGCPHDCDFCGVTNFYGGKYRRVSNGWVTDELGRIKQLNDERVRTGERPKSTFMADDDFYDGTPIQKAQVMDLLEQATAEGLIPPMSLTQLRVDAAEDSKFLSALEESNIGGVCLGIESVNDAALAGANKGQDSKRIEACVRLYRKAGLWIHGMFILGLDGDTRDTIRETVKWAKSNVHSAQFFAPVPLPGTRLTAEMESDDRVISKEYSLYDGSHVLIEPENLTPSDLQAEIRRAHRSFYAARRLGPLSLITWDALKPNYSHRNLGHKYMIDAALRLAELFGRGGQSWDKVTNWYDQRLEEFKPGELIRLPKESIA
jgi:radical SAM superfamily enzyme YgiQ (UPF0313 family)